MNVEPNLCLLWPNILKLQVRDTKLAHHTNDCIRNEDMEKAVAVKVELEKRGYGLAGRDGELSVAIGAAGHVDAFFQEVEGTHDHVLGVA